MSVTEQTAERLADIHLTVEDTPQSSEPVRDERPEIGGICVSCRRAPSCVYVGSGRGVVLQCEEHESMIRPRLERAGAPKAAPLAQGRSERRMGLCTTCDRSEDCTFPKPEGGVWHCLEYE